MKEKELTLVREALQETRDKTAARPIFITVSGAHLYGFASPDSDFDLRGAHTLPLKSIIGLDLPEETDNRMFEHQGREIDLVTHELKKYLTLLLNKNGYVLEQIYSPLVIQRSDAFDELRDLAKGCFTKHLYHHYRGFARNQNERFEKENPRKAKTLLYIYRVLLSGIWVLETCAIEANILKLNREFKLPFIDDLIAQKQTEHANLKDVNFSQHTKAIASLEGRLDEAFEKSRLPETPSTHAALHDFLVRQRLAHL